MAVRLSKTEHQSQVLGVRFKRLGQRQIIVPPTSGASSPVTVEVSDPPSVNPAENQPASAPAAPGTAPPAPPAAEQPKGRRDTIADDLKDLQEAVQQVANSVYGVDINPDDLIDVATKTVDAIGTAVADNTTEIVETMLGVSPRSARLQGTVILRDDLGGELERHEVRGDDRAELEEKALALQETCGDTACEGYELVGIHDRLISGVRLSDRTAALSDELLRRWTTSAVDHLRRELGARPKKAVDPQAAAQWHDDALHAYRQFLDVRWPEIDRAGGAGLVHALTFALAARGWLPKNALDILDDDAPTTGETLPGGMLKLDEAVAPVPSAKSAPAAEMRGGQPKSLEQLDVPVLSADWLLDEFDKAKQLPDSQRQQRIDTLKSMAGTLVELEQRTRRGHATPAVAPPAPNPGTVVPTVVTQSAVPAPAAKPSVAYLMQEYERARHNYRLTKRQRQRRIEELRQLLEWFYPAEQVPGLSDTPAAAPAAATPRTARLSRRPRLAKQSGSH